MFSRFYLPKAIKVSILPIVIFTFIFCFSLLNTVSKVSAACSPPATSYGTDTLSVNVPNSTTYTVWVQMQTSTSTNNSVQLSVGSSCFNVGGSALPTNQLTWVNYQNGSTSQVMQVALTAGSNTLVFTGTQQGVGIGSVLLLANPQCIPTGDGSNCTTNQPSPTQPGSLTNTIISPTSVKLNWTASTENQGPGVAGYNIYRNTSSGTPLATVPVGSLTYTDNTVSAGSSYTYYVKAYDVGNPPNSSTAASVTVQMPANPPAVPVVSATAVNSVSVNLLWPTSSDSGGPGLSSYKIYQGTPSANTLLGQVSYNSSTSTYNYPVNGLNQLSSYSFYVVAYDINGTGSQPSNVASVTTPKYPDPNQPTASSTAPVVTATSITFNWNQGSDPSPGPGVAGYTIYKNGAVYRGISSPSTTSFTDTGLTPNTTYNYCVSEYDSAVPPDSSTSYCLAAITTPNYPAPTTPSGLSSSSVTQTTANISWNASTDSGGPGIGGYIISRTNNQTGEVITTTQNGTSTSFSDSGLTPVTSYSYTVQAFDSATPVNYSAISPSYTITTIAYSPPNPVTNLTYTNVTPTGATISWTPATPASGGLPIDGYYVIVNGKTLFRYTGVASSTYTFTSLLPSTQYTIGVQAYDSFNDVSTTPSVTFVTQPAPDVQPPTAPTNLTASTISSTQANLKWTASTTAYGSVSYKIYRGLTPFNLSQIGTSSSTSFGDTNLYWNTRYYYYVVAYNYANQSSAHSNTATILTPDLTPGTAFISGHVNDSSSGTPLVGTKIVTGSQATVYGAETTVSYQTSAYYVLPNVIVESSYPHTVKFTYPNYSSDTKSVMTTQPVNYTVEERLTHL